MMHWSISAKQMVRSKRHGWGEGGARSEGGVCGVGKGMFGHGTLDTTISQNTGGHLRHEKNMMTHRSISVKQMLGSKSYGGGGGGRGDALLGNISLGCLGYNHKPRKQDCIRDMERTQ